MKRIDTLKLALLLTAILIWLEGYRLNSRPMMFGATAVVLVAFALRFVGRKPKPPSA